MRMEEIVELLRDMDERMERARMDYMLVGSVLSGVYGEPRMTRDIDFVVALNRGDVDRVLRIFEDRYEIQRTSVELGLQEESSFNMIDQKYFLKIDVMILKSDDYADIEFSRRRRIQAFGLQLWAASVEDAILYKLQWQDRSEAQERDVVGMLRAQPDLDWQYLEKWSRYFGIWKRLVELRP